MYNVGVESFFAPGLITPVAYKRDKPFNLCTSQKLFENIEWRRKYIQAFQVSTTCISRYNSKNLSEMNVSGMDAIEC